MHTHLTKFALLISTLVLLSCDPTSYVTQKHYFKNQYTLRSVKAPSFPFSQQKETNTIFISFPKKEEFHLQLSKSSCSGQYEANTKGTIAFTRTNCSSACCETDWDYYVLTLIRKATRYEDDDNGELVLFINNDNYLVLEVNKSIAARN